MTTLISLFATLSGPLFCKVSDMIFHSSRLSSCYHSLPILPHYGLTHLTAQSPGSTVTISEQLWADGTKSVGAVFECTGNVEKGAITVDPWEMWEQK
jgi:hypothetical protein